MPAINVLELYKAHLDERKERAYIKWVESGYKDRAAWVEFNHYLQLGIGFNDDMRRRQLKIKDRNNS